MKPIQVSLEDRFWLNQELKDLDGKYMQRPAEAGETITIGNVAAWPDVKPEDAIPVELNAEPDWVFLNQGSFVQVWVSNKPTPDRALVLAIVPSGNRWIALLRKQDLSREALAGSKEWPALRLEVVAGQPAESNALPSPQPTQSPISNPVQTNTGNPLKQKTP